MSETKGSVFMLGHKVGIIISETMWFLYITPHRAPWLWELTEKGEI